MYNRATWQSPKQRMQTALINVASSTIESTFKGYTLTHPLIVPFEMGAKIAGPLNFYGL